MYPSGRTQSRLCNSPQRHSHLLQQTYTRRSRVEGDCLDTRQRFRHTVQGYHSRQLQYHILFQQQRIHRWDNTQLIQYNFQQHHTGLMSCGM
jgi:hypothetical protein